MAITLDQLRNPIFVTKLVTRVKAPSTPLQDFYGVGPNGPNTQTVMGKDFSWDIFDKTRKRARVRADLVGPGTVTPIPVGNISARAIRIHESMPLMHEKIWGRNLGGGFGSIDRTGMNYIRKQAQELGRRAKLAREFAVSRMFRCTGFSVTINGDDLELGEAAAGAFDVKFMPDATATAQSGTVGGTFAGNWQTAGSALPHGELLALNALSEQRSGYPIKHAWCAGSTWARILKIDEIKGLAGTSNQPFAAYDRVTMTNEDGVQSTDFTASLRGIPWLTWHICDQGQETSAGTFETYIPDHRVLFTPDPSSDWLEVTQGSEFIKRDVMDAGSVVSGPNAWTTSAIDPAAEVLKNLDIFLPTPYLPNAWFYATVSA
jgi:hypothetical protein